MDDIIKISGAIGLSILEYKKNKVFIFYDDHSNIKYCKNKTTFLSNIFEYLLKVDKNTLLLLEEPFIDKGTNIKYLWNNIPHIEIFKKYYAKIINKCLKNNICYTFPVDIRLCLYEISFEEIELNLENNDYKIFWEMNIIEYFKNILYLFEIIEINFKIEDIKDKNINFVKKIFNIHKKSKYYKKLKEKILIFFNEFIIPNCTKNIKDIIILYNNKNYEYVKGFPFNNNFKKDEFLNYFDKINDGIMEFYIITLLLCFKRNISIFYGGYYHSNNIEYILTTYYDYKRIYCAGITENIETIKEEIINNCISVKKDYFINL